MPSPSSLSLREAQRQDRLWTVERELLAMGMQCIAGVDEAGRGPLAGPVVVAAVVLPPEFWPAGLNDSKQVAPEARERLDAEIREGATAWAVEVVPVETIDAVNILHATHLGMRAALQVLSPTPHIALIDGLPVPDLPVTAINLVQGDSRSASIAAASILAKVTRDRIMCELEVTYPGYGFARHKGYPTPEHLEALRRLGVSPVHRRSFAPVRACDQGAFPFGDIESEQP